MRLGFPEIAIIMVVIILIIVITRIIGAGRSTPDNNKKTGEMPFAQARYRAGRTLQRLGALGIVFIITGIISLLAGISLFKWVYWSYLWSFIAIGVGLVILYISKKK